MFTKDDMAEINPSLPGDFEQVSADFWNYVKGKFGPQLNIQKMYFDSLTKERMPEANDFVRKTNEKAYDFIVGIEAQLQATEDAILIEETASWQRMLENGDESSTTHDLLAQSMIEREKFVAKTISESLKDGEAAILFLSPGRRTSEYLSSDSRVIKVQPFDPSDYLNSWLVSMKLRANAQ